MAEASSNSFPSEIELDDALDVFRESIEVGIRTQIPGTVKAFRRNPRPNADITVGPNAILDDGTVIEIDTLTEVPVMYYTASGITIQTDLEVGDEVWISVPDRDTTAWLESGGQLEPHTRMRHDLSFAVCEPKMQSSKNVPKVNPGKKTLYIGDAGGQNTFLKINIQSGQVTIEATNIKLGESATQGVARITDKVLPDVTMAAWIAAVSGVLSQVPPTDFGLISTGSTKVLAG